MTYTNDQVVQMAREVGAEIFNNSGHYVVFSPEELAALCNKVERDTLLKAAEVAKGIDGERFVSRELRRMAGVSDA